MKRSGLAQSVRVAGWGLLHTVATQKHMKVHITAAVMVMIVGMALPLDLASRTTLLFCVAVVLFAEVLNTALESFVDLHIQEFHRSAMIAKDAAAAGVLVLSVATIAILADILWVHWELVEKNIKAVQTSLLFGVPLTCAVILSLWGPQLLWLKATMTLVALALAVPLWVRSNDPVFSVLLGLFVLVALFARPRPNQST